MKYTIAILVCISTIGNSAVLFSPQIQKDTIRTQVSTAQGTVQGTVEVTRRNTPYSSFRGIPFATPPIGPLRFKDPLPAQPWNGVLPATQFKTACVQPQGSNSQGSEDCLYLNVYTPHTNQDLLPVFVYVHGGAFAYGDSRENPEPIMDGQVVMVTVTYRLGVLGFLSLDTPDVPGNAAMKDLVMSLRWVQENIRRFSGDPNKVTIAGMSAGSAAVSLLQMSPLARGLFHKVFATSGTFLSDWAIQKNPKRMVGKLADILKLDSTNTEKFAQELRSLSAYEVSNAGIRVQADRGGQWDDLTFVPVMESTFNGVLPFLRKMPIEYVKSGEFTDCPTMIGHASKEFALFHNQGQTTIDINDDLVIVPDRWRLDATEWEVQRLAYLIREHYLGTQNYDAGNRQMVLNAVELLGDVVFTQPIIETAVVLAEYMRSPVYNYRFSYRGGLNNGNINNLGIQGATHGDDTNYLFYRQGNINDFSSDGYVLRRLIKLLTNFVKTGNPTPEPTTLLPIQWLPATPDNDYYLEINGETTLSTRPNNYRTVFWNDLEEKWRSGNLW